MLSKYWSLFMATRFPPLVHPNSEPVAKFDQQGLERLLLLTSYPRVPSREATTETATRPTPCSCGLAEELLLASVSAIPTQTKVLFAIA